MKTVKLIPVLLATLLAAPVFAQSAASEVQRSINQQQRIESGLQSGQLNTREAAKLEREEAQVSKLQSQAMKDGTLTAAEKKRIERAQDKVSRDIYAEKHDAQTGNPNSASSKRMQADVQRNINQQQRIKNGIQDGSLTNHEVAKLERGEAKIDREEAKAGRDGHVGAHEQQRIERTENRVSRRIHHEKTDSQSRS